MSDPESNSLPLPRRARKSAASSTLRTPELLQQTDQQRDASPDLSSEEIARRAYARWEDSDRSPGRDQEHWYAAEEDLRRSRRGDRDRNRRPRQGEDMGVGDADEET
jgi:hypothetical protein